MDEKNRLYIYQTVEIHAFSFCGIGVNLRKEVYCKNKTLGELESIFTIGYTYNDMIRYNNLTYEYLKSSDGVILVEK